MAACIAVACITVARVTAACVTATCRRMRAAPETPAATSVVGAARDAAGAPGRSRHRRQPLLHAGDVDRGPAPGDLCLVGCPGVPDRAVLGERALLRAGLGEPAPHPGPRRRPRDGVEQRAEHGVT